MDTGRLNQRHVPDFGFGRILIASVFLLFGLFALTADGQEKYDFSRFGNEVRENTSYASQKAAERIRTAVEYAVPFTRGSARITIYIAENQETEPSLRYIRSPREVRVIVPEDALLWVENPEYLHKITAWMILARIGEPPSNAPLIQNHWIVRAIARKTMGEAEKISMPMAEYAPCSRTLTANGYLPELRMVFSSIADERSSVLSRMSDEYAELLYNYCRSCGLIQNRIVQKIITYTIKNPDAKQFPLFLSAGISAGLNKIFSTKQNRVKNPGQAEQEFDALSLAEKYRLINDSFQRFVYRTQLNYFCPVSSAYLEQQFKDLRNVSFFNVPVNDQEEIPAEEPDDLVNVNGISVSVTGTEQENAQPKAEQENAPPKADEEKQDGTVHQFLFRQYLPGALFRKDGGEPVKAKAGTESAEAASSPEKKTESVKPLSSEKNKESADEKLEVVCLQHEIPVLCTVPSMRAKLMRTQAVKIRNIMKTAPSPMLESLGAVYRAFQRKVENEKDAAQASGEILKAEEKFFAALKHFQEQERSLAAAERRLIPPGARFHESFRVIEEQKKREDDPYPELQAMLNVYDSFNAGASAAENGEIHL